MSRLTHGLLALIFLAVSGVASGQSPKPDRVASRLAKRPIPTHAIHALAFRGDGEVIALGTGKGELILWNFETGKTRKTKAHKNWTFAISFSPDDRIIATGGGDNLIKLWDADTLELQQTLSGHSDDVHGLVFTPDGRTIISVSDDRTLRWWSLADGKNTRTVNGHTEQITAVAISADGKLVATGSRDDTVKLWDAQDGSESGSMVLHVNDVLDLDFSPDGLLLASGSYDTTAIIWNQTLNTEKRIKTHKDRVFSVAFSHNGRWFATAGEDKTILVHDLQTADLRIRKIRRKADISRLAFSPTAPLLAATSSDGSASILDVRTGRQLATLTPESLKVPVKSSRTDVP